MCLDVRWCTGRWGVFQAGQTAHLHAHGLAVGVDREGVGVVVEGVETALRRVGKIELLRCEGLFARVGEGAAQGEACVCVREREEREVPGCGKQAFLPAGE